MPVSEVTILSIQSEREEGANKQWCWTKWSKIGSIPVDFVQDQRDMLKWLREKQYLSGDSKGKLATVDDGTNYVVVARHTREPILAIVYSEAQEAAVA